MLSDIDQQFYFTISKISATLIGLVYVAITAFLLPSIARVRDEFKKYSSLLKLRFPDYLLCVITSNLTIFILPLLISFNFISTANNSRLASNLLFIFYIIMCFIFTFRVHKSYLGGDRNKIKEQIKPIIYFRVMWLPLLIFLGSLLIVILLFLDYYPVDIPAFILFGLILLLFDYLLILKPESLFFQVEQFSFGIVQNSAKIFNERLQKMKSALKDEAQLRILEEICKPIEKLKDSFNLIEKSNIVVAESIISAKDSYDALKELSEKPQYAKLFLKYEIFEEQEKEKKSD